MLLQTKGIHFIIDKHRIDIDYSKLDTQPSHKHSAAYQLTSDGVCIYYRGEGIYDMIRNYTYPTKSQSLLPPISSSSLANTPRANMRREPNKSSFSGTTVLTPRQVCDTTPIDIVEKGSHQKFIASSMTVGKSISDDFFGKAEVRSETRLPPSLKVQPPVSKTQDSSITLKDQPPINVLPTIMISGGRANESAIVFPNSPTTPATTLSTMESATNRPLKLSRPLEEISPSIENQKENIPMVSTPTNNGYFNMFSRPSQSSQSTVTSRLEGIRNLGNTCYLNAVLEALLSLKDFSSDMTGLLWRSIRKFRFMNLHTDKTTFDSSCMTQLANIIK